SRLWNLLMPSPWCFLCMCYIFLLLASHPNLYLASYIDPTKILTHFPASSIFEQILTNFTTRRPCD
ncbi:hypothetical protein K435DRAFT_777810, partial [Dendrothele bispora CBS 962.96]